MSKPKRINMTYIGDGLKRIGGTYTGDSGVIHALEEDDDALSLCGNSFWGYCGDKYERDIDGKIDVDQQQQNKLGETMHHVRTIAKMNLDKDDRHRRDQQRLVSCVEEIKTLSWEFYSLRTKCKHYISDPGNALMREQCGEDNKAKNCAAETCPLTN